MSIHSWPTQLTTKVPRVTPVRTATRLVLWATAESVRTATRLVLTVSNISEDSHTAGTVSNISEDSHTAGTDREQHQWGQPHGWWLSSLMLLTVPAVYTCGCPHWSCSQYQPCGCPLLPFSDRLHPIEDYVTILSSLVLLSVPLLWAELVRNVCSFSFKLVLMSR